MAQEGRILMDDKWCKIQNLDLENIKDNLKRRKSWWWRWRNDVEKLDIEYRQFLYLVVTNPGKSIVPWSEPMDDLWHEHMLDTAKYRKDCNEILGQFIDHNPNLPKGTPEHKNALKDTEKTYTSSFKSKKEEKKATKTTEQSSASNCSTPGVIFIETPVYSSPAPSYDPPASSPSPSYDAPASSCSSGTTSSCSSGSSCSSSSCSSSSCSSGCSGGGCSS
jgi:hypothetical protein